MVIVINILTLLTMMTAQDILTSIKIQIIINILTIWTIIITFETLKLLASIDKLLI